MILEKIEEVNNHELVLPFSRHIYLNLNQIQWNKNTLKYSAWLESNFNLTIVTHENENSKLKANQLFGMEDSSMSIDLDDV